MEKSTSDIHILLLAAGKSSRMGKPKPLLQWGNENLLEYQANRIKSLGYPLSVVLGYKAEEIVRQSQLSEVGLIQNPNWSLGMGNSIAFGVGELIKVHPDIKAVLIALVDQPLVSTEHLENLIAFHDPDKQNIVVSQAEDGHWSVPVLFDQKFFPELRMLMEDRGAMSIVRKHADVVELIKSSDSLEDMDTQEKYEELIARFQRLNN